MKRLIGRPPSVWITQVLFLLTLIGFGVAFLGALLSCFSGGPSPRCPASVTPSDVLTSLLVIVLAGLTFWGLQTGRRYGQGLAVTLLIAAVVVGISDSPLPRALNVVLLSLLSLLSGGGGLPDPLQACGHPFGGMTYLCGYSSYAALAWRVIADLLPSLLLGVLAVRLLGSDAARRFFHQRSNG
jgi:hypothetical protein